jgi:hypothetical protein
MFTNMSPIFTSGTRGTTPFSGTTTGATTATSFTGETGATTGSALGAVVLDFLGEDALLVVVAIIL